MSRRRATAICLNLIALHALLPGERGHASQPFAYERIKTVILVGPQNPSTDMQAVLDQYGRMVDKPVHTLTPNEARQQPTLADAARALLKTRGKKPGAEPVAQVFDRSIAGPAGAIPLRIYAPEGSGPFPVILYFHGGGFVIGDLNSYDASARALANAAKALVISSHYRQGPENKFPAAAEDAFVAYQWTRAHAGELNGDPLRIAVAGEGAGGNLAAGICIRSRDSQVPPPLHQLLIYPLLDSRTDTPSYSENSNAIPFGRPLIDWYLANAVAPADRTNPRFAILRTEDFADLSPATIITARIDPLRFEGETYARKLREEGVDVAHRDYDGVVHDFFGLGAVVPQARSAVLFAGGRLQQAFKDAQPPGR